MEVSRKLLRGKFANELAYAAFGIAMSNAHTHTHRHQNNSQIAYEYSLLAPHMPFVQNIHTAPEQASHLTIYCINFIQFYALVL